MPVGRNLRILSISLLLGLSSAGRAEVLRIPQDFPTIQAALDMVGDEDSIIVSLETYAEELSAPPRRFWLIGDVEADTGDFPRPVIDPSTLDSAQWRHCMLVPEGAEITVEKMRFVNGPSMYPRPDAFATGGVIVNTVQPIVFRFCAFDSVYRAIVHDVPAGLEIKVIIEDCRFTNAPRIQIRAMDGQVIARRCFFHARRCVSDVIIGHDSSLVEQCVFTGDSLNNFLSLSGTGLAVHECVFGPADSCSATIGVMNDGFGVIEDNIVHDISFDGGIGGSNLIGGDAPILWRHNSFVQNSAYANGSTGIFLGQQTPPGPYGAEVDTNLFQDCSQPAGVRYGKALTIETRVSATSNHFLNLLPASSPSIAALSANNVCRLRYNQFQSVDYAVNCSSRAVDAILNYWGDASGPFNALYNPAGLGARVDDSVAFIPWCPDTICFESAPENPFLLTPSSFLLSCYPNPFNSILHLTLIPSQVGIVKLELYDVLGRRVEEIWHGPLAFQKDVTFDASALASGIYFARVTDVISRKNLAMAKLVLLK